MSNYETDPAGTGVGKSYGTRGVGGVAGAYSESSQDKEFSVELSAGELNRPLSFDLPAYALESASYNVSSTYTVTEAFEAGSTFQMALDGTPAGAIEVLDVLGQAAFDPSVGAAIDGTQAAGVISVVPNATAIASATGKVRIVAIYRTHPV